MLIGLERGWRERDRPEGGRVAGLRTFALIGLLGGVLGLAAPQGGGALPAAGLACVAAYFVVAYPRAARQARTLSITTALAGLVTFGLGLLAAAGHPLAAVAAAVAAALLLDLKGPLHRGLRRIEGPELTAVLQLGVLSAVILPLLPDRGMGPFSALNPFRIWLAVLLVAALSLAGHVATRWRGGPQGLLWTGLLGGLVSSTAVTLALARRTASKPELHAAAAAAIVAASGVMFVRMAVVVAVLQPGLAARADGPLLAMAAACFAAAALLWRGRGPAASPAAAGGKLFDLPTALGFGAVLALLSVLVPWARQEIGLAGVYAVAFLSGLADVDAVVISSAQLYGQGALDGTLASLAMAIAALANLLAKGATAWLVGGRPVGARVVAAFLFAAAAALAMRAIAQGAGS